MLSSAMHFAIGFFGYPFEGQYEQSVTIEHEGVSVRCPSLLLLLIPTHVSSTTPWHRTRRRSHVDICILMPHATLLSCPNANHTNRATWYVRRWVEKWVWASTSIVVEK